MRTLRQINIKNRPHYNIKNFDPNLLSIDKMSFKSIDNGIYHIEYITMS